MPSPFTPGSYEDAYYNSLDESGKNQLNYSSSRYGAYGRTGVVAGLANNPNYVAFINANKPSLDYSLAQQGKLSWADFYRDNPSYAPKPDPLTQAMSADVHKVEGATSGLLGIVTLALMVPGMSSEIGSGILAQAGITGASPAVNAAVGSAAINTATTLAKGGDFQEVLQSAASGAAASGINVQMGGGVAGAVTGSIAGTAIAGGDANQVVMNALAAGVGAGVQGATGSAALGSLARSTVITGEVSGESLFNAAMAGIKAGDSIEKTERSINNALEDLSSTFGAQAEGQDTVAGEAGQDTLGGAETTDQDQIVDPFQDISPPPVEDPNAVPLDPVTIQGQREQPVVSDVVTDVTRSATPASTDQQIIDLIAQETAPVAADPNAGELEQVIITGKREPESNVSPVVTDVSTGRPTAELDRVTVTAAREPDFEEEPNKEEEPDAEEEPKKEEEPRQIYPTVTGVPPKRRPRTPIITGATTPRLLADALAAYRPAGAIEGKGTGDERQDVWNEKSLRLRDALGL